MVNKNILVTGGAGFIGSNFIIYLLNKYNNYNIINLDKLTYAGDLNNLTSITSNANFNARYRFIQGDITNKQLVSNIFNQFCITDVIHFAAESHVDNSITNSEVFFTTNVLGTLNLINTAKDFWKDCRNKFSYHRFHHISTDEVYGSLGDTGLFTETTAYAPNSPYSASKASSDLIIRSYFHTYGLNVVTSNCSNNYGPRQHIEKFIPTVITKAISQKPIPIYGTGNNIRDWLYIDDHCSALDKVFHDGQAGESYNIGSNCEKTNLTIASAICDALNVIRPNKNNYNNLITFTKDRPGHDKRYAVDATKIKSLLGWQPNVSFEQGILKTIEWYLTQSV
jgi:dTDP-glucose 4,6-dehydratase